MNDTRLPMHDFQTLSLTGRVVRLEPLTASHSGDLWHVADPEIFRYKTLVPPDWTPNGFAEYVHRVATHPRWRAFAIILLETGQAIGSTSYTDVVPENRAMGIGATWIGRPWQGTQVNPECKFMLLQHSFEACDAVRVQIQCDGRNLQSQRAIEKLGAVKEGVLRKHLTLPDGYIRDTVVYSVIDCDWPEVRDRLRRRLGYTP